MKTIFSKELSSVLSKVLKNTKDENSTAPMDVLKQEEISLIRAAYFELRDMLKKFEDKNSDSLNENNLDLKLGRYNISGRIFPHLWGSLFPIEAESISEKIIQLFAYRDSKVFRIGIGLSVTACGDEEMVKAILDRYSKNSVEF
jgi:recombinational DNA repair protein RecR